MEIFLGIVAVIVFLAMFGEFILDILDLILSIFGGIFSIFESIFDFFQDMFYGAKRLKRKADDNRAIRQEKQIKEKRRKQRQELQNFETVDQLPDDYILLEQLYHDFHNKNDEQKAFICLKKAVSLGSNLQLELSMMYLDGQVTEVDYEKAVDLQQNYFLHNIRSDKDIELWEKWWKMKWGIRNVSGMRDVAETLIKNKNILGIFLLEHVRFIEYIQEKTKAGQSPDEKSLSNPYGYYYLYLHRGRQQEDLEKACQLGCYMAAVKLKNQDMMDVLRAEAQKLISQTPFVETPDDKAETMIDLVYICADAGYGFVNAKTYEESKKHYAMILKLAKAGYSLAIKVFGEIVDLACDKYADKYELTYDAFDQLRLDFTIVQDVLKLGLFRESALYLMYLISRRSFNEFLKNENRYADFVKETALYILRETKVEDLKEDEDLLRFLNGLTSYSYVALNYDKNMSYVKNIMSKEYIDKIEKAYHTTIEELERKYKNSSSDIQKNIGETFHLLVVLKKDI